MVYSPNYDLAGRFLGVTRSVDGALIPNDPNNTDYQAFLVWNAANGNPVSTANDPTKKARVRRPLYSIVQALQALSTTQQANVWADLSSGTPAKYLLDAGPNAASIASMWWACSSSGATGNALLQAKLLAAAYYAQDNPGYLIAPSFDPTISIDGTQPG